MRYFLVLLLVVGLGLSVGVGRSPAQPKPAENKDAPRLLLAVPLGVPAGKETKIVLRGLRIDTTTQIECLESSARIEIVRKGKNAPPNMFKPERLGDTEVEVKLPASTPGVVEWKLVVVTPAGKSNPLTVLVDDGNVVAEKEPNGGYRAAQSIALSPMAAGQTVAGVIQSNQDVDCFRFEGNAGERVRLEIRAAQLGSALDAILTLSDDAGKILAQSDDQPENRDPTLELELPRKGSYIVTVQDAHDLGSSLHGYRLLLRRK